MNINIGDWVGDQDALDYFSYYPCYVLEKNEEKGLYVCEVFTEDLHNRKRWIKSWYELNEEKQKEHNRRLANSKIKDKDLYIKKLNFIYSEDDPFGEDN